MDNNEAWITMFRRIPASLHDGLSLCLVSGVEIVVQKFMKLEADFAIIRGRVSGTQETGRIVLIPYSQMAVATLAQSLKDPEVEAVFGKGAAPALVDLPTTAPEPTSESAQEDATVNDGEAEVNAPKKPAPVSRAALVAKMRDRLKDK